MLMMGIDPGLTATGYGIIQATSGSWRVVNAGDVRPPRGTLPQRLAFLHDGLGALLRQFQPDVAVLEQLFTHHRHVATASLMAHARGAACLAIQEAGVAFAEYQPRRIKQALTGRGNASKEQVARMVGQWLGYRDARWSRDATDALALAVAHAQMTSARQRLIAGAPVR